MTTPEQSPIQNLIEVTEIRDVRLVRVDAEVHQITSDVGVRFTAGGAKVNKSDEEIVVLFEHSADFSTPDGDPVASVKLGHVARFTYHDGLELDEDSLGHWIFGNVYFMVYPYVRASLQDTCMRLGLPAVVLGYLKRGEMAPEAVSLVVNTTTYQHERTDDEQLPLGEPQA